MFIELMASNGEQVLVNINNIEWFEPGEDEKTLIGLTSDDVLYIENTCGEVKEMLVKAGKLLCK
ncbi:hypothetical protein [Oceanobacillus oncorhynchi]|uniref:hypothetical protein n=1 Tax=Oceanobacillus oncorhynchi TaxID=545501 RepID=UPI0025A440A4|nr:hypothetical protein [Oceanobacillus oncorhynchi]MDM8098686.1 hypothetical protein [Oceanobacillus oncorhynchi]